MRKKGIEKFLTIATVIIALILWIGITTTGYFSETIIPSPQSVWESFLEVSQHGYKGHTLLEHIGTSMQRLVIAYVLVVVTAIPLGLLSGYNSKVRAILEPLVESDRCRHWHIIQFWFCGWVLMKAQNLRFYILQDFHRFILRV